MLSAKRIGAWLVGVTGQIPTKTLPAYAFEELIAELGAAFLAAQLGLSLEPRPYHAAYLASWLKVLRDDPRTIVPAAAKA